MEIPTVRIKSDTPLGYAIINESDFDPSEHKLYDADSDHIDEEQNSSVLKNSKPEIEEPELSTDNQNEPPPEPKQRKRRSSVESES